MKKLTMEQTAAAINGRVLCGNSENIVSRVSRDSRDVDGNTLFFALVGANRDAHEFIGDVVRNGCGNIVISESDALESVKDKNVTAILVDDTTKALQRLAAWYIRELDINVIGVTGSVGKTTTKDLLNAACSVKYKTGCTKGNYNNHIGLPLTVLSFEEDTEIGILEMGMDKYGEIDFLADLARPHIAVITCIGSAHMEFFGSRENIMKAKMEITNYLSPSDILVISRGEDLLRPENIHGEYHLISSGEEEDNDYIVSDITDNGAAGMEFRGRRSERCPCGFRRGGRSAGCQTFEKKRCGLRGKECNTAVNARGRFFSKNRPHFTPVTARSPQTSARSLKAPLWTASAPERPSPPARKTRSQDSSRCSRPSDPAFSAPRSAAYRRLRST